MSIPEQDDRPRSWAPMLIAFAVAVAVVVAAIIWWLVGASLSSEEQAAITACEALHEDEGLPTIVRGGVDGPGGDGVYEVAWEFEDGARGGCNAEVENGVVVSATVVGDVADD